GVAAGGVSGSGHSSKEHLGFAPADGFRGRADEPVVVHGRDGRGREDLRGTDAASLGLRIPVVLETGLTLAPERATAVEAGEDADACRAFGEDHAPLARVPSG